MGEISGAARNKGVLVHCLFAPHLHVSVLTCFNCALAFECLSLSYVSFVSKSLLVFRFTLFLLFIQFSVSHHAASSFPVFSVNSFLCALLPACHLSISPLSISIPSLLLHLPSFPLLSSVYFSGEYTAGRTSLLLSHSARLLTHSVDC